MAGTGIRGQFEEKFKALIKDIEDEVKRLFPSIDSADLCQGREHNMLHR